MGKRRETLVTHVYSAFTLATLEPSQTSLISFSKFNSSRVAGTWEVPVVVLLSTFKINYTSLAQF